LTRASAAVLAVAAYALAGEAAAFERRALGLGRVDFSSLNDEEEEDEEDATDATDATDARFRAAFRSDEKAKRDAARVASASPFGSRDESLLRDALADFVVRSFAGRNQSDEDEDFADFEKNEEKLFHETLFHDDCDWLGNDLAAKLAARLADSRDEEILAERAPSSSSLLEETRDGVERFLRRCRRARAPAVRELRRPRRFRRGCHGE
jgi:hypothetical protein